jgi:transposase InsO family protein
LTDTFTRQKKQSTGYHSFDKTSAALGVERFLLTPSRCPPINGMVERFNGCIVGLLNRTRFVSTNELKATLEHSLIVDSNHIPQKSPGCLHL